MKKIIRISRHMADEKRLQALRNAFGLHVIIVETDVRYGDDPVQTVVDLVNKIGGDVVAIEAVAPISVLAKLVQAEALGHVKLIRVEFMKDESGRAKVVDQDSSGRDILAFSHYEVVERVDIVTRRL